MESMNKRLEIVPATPEDATEIQKVYYETWLATYPDKESGVTKEDIEDLFKDEINEEGIKSRAEKIVNMPSSEIFLLAKEGAKVIGFCRAIKSEDKNKLKSIYILPKFQAKGIGQKLWKEIQMFLDPNKDTFVELTEYNIQAKHFYEKLGFQDTGRRFTDESMRMKSGSIMTEMEMVLKTLKN